MGDKDLSYKEVFEVFLNFEKEICTKNLEISNILSNESPKTESEKRQSQIINYGEVLSQLTSKNRKNTQFS